MFTRNGATEDDDGRQAQYPSSFPIVDDDIDVNARLGIVPILVPKRRLGFV